MLVGKVTKQQRHDPKRKTYLSTWWLGEPQGPLVHQWMLDGKVVLVVKYRDLFLSIAGDGSGGIISGLDSWSLCCLLDLWGGLFLLFDRLDWDLCFFGHCDEVCWWLLRRSCRLVCCGGVGLEGRLEEKRGLLLSLTKKTKKMFRVGLFKGEYEPDDFSRRRLFSG